MSPLPSPETASGKAGRRVVVIVSGGDAVTPFTTPDRACATGLPAGNTSTALREHLLAAGFEVYTAPAMNAPGPVAEPDPDSFGAFGGAPSVLPAELTLLSTGPIDAAGAALARFVEYLGESFGVGTVDWVGHSNGGLFARAATRVLQRSGSPVQVGSLLTIGTPWLGSVPFRVIHGELPDNVLDGHPGCRSLLDAMRAEVAESDRGLSAQQLRGYLDGWNAAQAGVLDGLRVHSIGGGHFARPASEADDNAEVWPFDGVVAASSAVAAGLGADVLGIHSSSIHPLTHSIFVSEFLGLDWSTSLTWNPVVLAEVAGFLDEVRQEPDPRPSSTRQGRMEASHPHPERTEPMSDAAVQVSDNRDASRFEATLDGRLAGFAEYQLTDELVVFTHTEVLPAYEGQGVGSALAQYALDQVKADGTRKALPTCPFIEGWIQRHPDYLAITYGAQPPAES